MDKRYRITREEAIQILSTRDAHGVLCGYTSGVTEAFNMAIEALTRPQGEWKWSNGGECSECGFHNSNFDYNYCPNCGAKMGDEEE